MSAYIVSWGVINQGNYMETDSIVHTDEAQARQEYSLVDLGTCVKGAFAQAAREHGCPSYCRLERIEMLDEREQPTNKVSAWVYDASKELLDEKVSA